MKYNNQDQVNVEHHMNTICGIPVFFAVRAGGWLVLALAVAVFSIGWENTMGYTSPSFNILTIILSVIFCLKGLDLIYIAVKKRYFTCLLTCQDILLSKVTAQMKNYIDPTSQTPFRISNQVSFISEDGLQITFTFDRSRKFYVGSKYLFYFRAPSHETKELTVEHLEYLKIDHSIIPFAKL